MAGNQEADPGSLLAVPDIRAAEPPESLCLVAEDVVAGLEIVIRVLKESAPDIRDSPGVMEYERRLKAAGEKLVVYFENLYQVGCVPYLELGGQDARFDRLGVLPDGDYALFEAYTRAAGAKLAINYAGYHMVPPENYERDMLPGSQDIRQLYLGYAPRHLGDMTGYALSWNRFRGLYSTGELKLDALPMTKISQLGGVDESGLDRFLRR